MATASASIDIPVSADTIWQLVGGFGSLADWNSGIATAETGEGGRVRHLVTRDGAVIVERLLRFDEAGRSYTYGIVESPIPQKDYRSTLEVTAIGDNSARVEWSGQFTADGVGDEVVIGVFQGIYEGGLQSLQDHFTLTA